MLTLGTAGLEAHDLISGSRCGQPVPVSVPDPGIFLSGTGLNFDGDRILDQPFFGNHLLF